MKLPVVSRLVVKWMMLALVHGTTFSTTPCTTLQEKMAVGIFRSMFKYFTQELTRCRQSNNLLTNGNVDLMLQFRTCLNGHYFHQSKASIDMKLRLCFLHKSCHNNDRLLGLRLIFIYMKVLENINSFCKRRFLHRNIKINVHNVSGQLFPDSYSTSTVKVRKLLFESGLGYVDSKRERFPRSATSISSDSITRIPTTTTPKSVVIVNTTPKAPITVSSYTESTTLSNKESGSNNNVKTASYSVRNTNQENSSLSNAQTSSSNETSQNVSLTASSLASTMQTEVTNISDSSNITAITHYFTTTTSIIERGNFDYSVFSGLLLVAAVANISRRPAVYGSLIGILCVSLAFATSFLLWVTRDRIKCCFTNRLAYSTRSDEIPIKMDTSCVSQNVSASSNELTVVTGTSESPRYSDVKSIVSESLDKERMSSSGSRESSSSDAGRSVAKTTDDELMTSTGSGVSGFVTRPLLEPSLSIEGLLSTIASLSNENQTISLTFSCNSIKRHSAKTKQEKDIGITMEVTQDSGGSVDDLMSTYDNNRPHEDARGYSKLITRSIEPIPEIHDYDYIDHLELGDVGRKASGRGSNYINVTLPEHYSTSPGSDTPPPVPRRSTVDASPYVNEDNVLVRGNTLRSSLV